MGSASSGLVHVAADRPRAGGAKTRLRSTLAGYHGGMAEKQRRSKSEKEAHLQADLKEVWQDESPLTAKRTEVADEVDGELGTRHQASTSD